jgi:hypothetical protein
MVLLKAILLLMQPARRASRPGPAWIAQEFVALLRTGILSLRSTPLEINVLLERHSASDAAGPARKSASWHGWLNC